MIYPALKLTRIEGKGDVYIPAQGIRYWESLRDGGTRIYCDYYVREITEDYSEDDSFVEVGASPDMIQQLYNGCIVNASNLAAVGSINAQISVANQQAKGLAVVNGAGIR
jgi:hypothetical protein